MIQPHVRKRVFTVALSYTGLLLLTVYSYGQMRSSADAVRRADEELKTCRRLISEINDLQQRPGFAAVEQESPAAMANRVERAARESQLPAAAVVRVAPHPISRLANTDYQISATSLELQNVTLKQVAAFSQNLIDEDHGLTLRDLRLYAGSDPGVERETWSADLTLTQLIFSPTNR